jgi:ABC-type phosphate transport system substrate-binding protein
MRSKLRVLAVAAMSLALVALGLIGASSAMAEKPNNPCLGGTSIMGNGSSLQTVAQTNVWIPGFGKAGCPEGADKVEYLGGGSAAGLKAFGVGGLETPVSSGEHYIGTDDAPNGTQLDEMETAAKGKLGVAGEEQELVIPVAQAAIAIIVKPPAGCKVTKIRNHDLELVFNGLLLLWSEFEEGSEKTAACEVEIMRDVRFDGSGTTYQFKHYLFEINLNPLTGTGTTSRTWEELQPEEVPNLEWPEGTELTPVLKPTEAGGKKLVELVKTDTSAIGYANLADARSLEEAGKLEWVEVQTNGSLTVAEENLELETPSFAKAGTSATEPSTTAAEANCKETEYTNIPLKPEEPDADWSKTYGGHPKVLKGHYSICTLTWDVALVNYELAGFGAEAPKIGQTAYDYMRYVTSESPEGGQKEISNNHDYLGLFTAPTNVLEIALKLSLLVAGGPRVGPVWALGATPVQFEPGLFLLLITVPIFLIEDVTEKWHWECGFHIHFDFLGFGHLWLLEWIFTCSWLTSTGGTCPATASATEPLIPGELNSATTAKFEEIKLKLETETDACVSTGEQELTGNLEANWANTNEKLEFPTTALAGSSLKDSKGNSALFTGTFEKFEPTGVITAESAPEK